MSKLIRVRNLEELNLVCDEIETRIPKQNLILLKGEMGTGKTRLVQSFVQRKNPEYQISSPTFSLVNEYQLSEDSIYHFDLYRLKELREIEDIGFWEYIDSGRLVFIEWPEKIADILPTNRVLRIDIELNLNGWREFLVY